MAAETVEMVVERGADGGYVATAPSLPGCTARGASREELREEMRRAVREWGRVPELVEVEVIEVDVG